MVRTSLFRSSFRHATRPLTLPERSNRFCKALMFRARSTSSWPMAAARTQLPQLLRRLQRQDDRVRLIANPAGYAAHGFNLGIRAARGRNVMIMSAHARVAPDHLAMCVRALDENRAAIAGRRHRHCAEWNVRRSRCRVGRNDECARIWSEPFQNWRAAADVCGHDRRRHDAARRVFSGRLIRRRSHSWTR